MIKAFFARSVIPTLLLVFVTSNGYGADGSHLIGIGAASLSPKQNDVNAWIDSTGAAGRETLGGAYELIVDYEHRFSGGIFSMLIRPSYFSQSSDGGGISARLTGTTIFSFLRLYPFENDLFKFFVQAGLGYGALKMDLENKNTGGSGSFDGNAFGAIGGLGVQMCFAGSHCVVLEGNFRSLPIERNTGSASGTLGGSITQVAGELELEQKDLGTTLSGFQGVLGYRLMF